MQTTAQDQGFLSTGTLNGPAHALLRIGAGVLFMQHGAQKLFGVLGGMGGGGETAALASLMGVAGVIEFFGGLLLVVGLFARPVAFLAAGQMAAAVFMAHLPQGLVPIQNGANLALMYMLAWLFIAAAGAGPLSVDALRARRHATSQRPVLREPAARPAAVRSREVA